MLIHVIVMIIALIAVVMVGVVVYFGSDKGKNNFLCLFKAVIYAGLAIVTFLSAVYIEVKTVDAVVFIAAIIEAMTNWIEFKKSIKSGKLFDQ